MKAEIKTAHAAATLTLSPETPDEQTAVLSFIEWMAGRAHMMNSRGFTYMEPSVSFHIQPMPRGD